MSEVTSALIYVEFADDLSPITQPLSFTSSRPELNALERFMPIDTKTPGGYKYMEVDVFACAFNYIATDDLINWFRGLPWGPADTALLLITPDEGGVIVITQGPDIQLPTRKATY